MTRSRRHQVRADSVRNGGDWRDDGHQNVPVTPALVGPMKGEMRVDWADAADSFGCVEEQNRGPPAAPASPTANPAVAMPPVEMISIVIRRL